ncbi:MAG: signal recognition particle-docking protein FtsY [Actinobacteria bacterium]|nr:signal recognition particle-docking protein FtsY [Actinomycetota bacterium]
MLNFEKKGIFERALIKTKQKLLGFISSTKFDFEDLEEMLILADLPIEFVEEVVENARANFVRASDAIPYLKKKLIEELESNGKFTLELDKPNILILTGVNGAGKTTTAAKLANYYKKKNLKVLLAAADTFRAAGSEQLEVWAERIGVSIVSQQRGADPASVVFDATKSTLARGYDIMIADSAGRLHTKSNLMSEMKKIVEAAKKASEGVASVKSLLVIDANFGTNVLNQVSAFSEAAEVNFLIGTKLDSSSKAGSLISASIILEKPIAFVGTGENIDDIEEFDAESFVEALFEGVAEN